MPTMPFKTPLTTAPSPHTHPFHHFHLHLPTFTTSLTLLPVPLKLKAQDDFIRHLLVHIILLRTELSVRMGRYMAALVQRGECDEYDDGRRRDEEGRRVDERSHVEERRCDQDGRRVVEACEVLVHALEVLKGQVFDRWEGVAELGVRERMAVLEGLLGGGGAGRRF